MISKKIAPSSLSLSGRYMFIKQALELRWIHNMLNDWRKTPLHRCM